MSTYFLKPTAHLLFFSFVFGGTAFYSYVASPIAFKTLDKDAFSKLQHSVFPYFFQMQSFAPVILGATAPLALRWGPFTSLAVASTSGLVNYLWLLPWTQKVKSERRKLANEVSGEELERRDASLRKEFGKSHGLSLLFNMTNVLAMTVYGFFLARGLVRYVPK
ncbi:LAMI_0F07448g1_1 [Lachancea mirantina]|uniref:LAMI_0F07448g1_1 n=1 Tax=Lachancea mirantina TaxID=1230905 RepID=A0A1G4JZW5_9SACH|nr:LAMI_0F07448g1_1 [Lachancea mirantina]